MNISMHPDELTKVRPLSGSVENSNDRLHHPTLVIGGGPAGIRTAQELSRNGIDSIIFNAERWQPYNRVKLTPLLSGDVQIGQIHQDLKFSGPGRVKLYSDHSVVDIDRENKSVTTRFGRIFSYNKIVFATGSRAYVPPIPGHDLPGIYTFRNFDDVEKLLARSFSSRRCIVVGGGLLGLEAARGMVDRSVETWVIEHEAYLMARQLDIRAAQHLQSAVENMGLKVLTGTRITAFTGDTRVERAKLHGHKPIDCDTVILCTGIRANMELAREIGLTVGRGIRVNANLQTSDPDIYAVGECAEFEDHIYGLVGPCFEQAQTAVSHICGKQATYAGSLPATKLKIVGTDVFSMGDVEQIDQRSDLNKVDYENNGDATYRRLVLKQGKLIGAIAIGDWPEFNRLQEAIKARKTVYPWHLRRFRKTGLIWPKTKPKGVRDWPRSATVCNCTGVSRGQIGDSIALGATTLDAVKRDTGASTVCGTCKIHINELLGSKPKREPVKSSGTITALSVVTGLLALLIILFPVWPTASDIELRGLADTLFLESFTKQVSGYSLLVLSLLAAILSLRKRIGWLQLGNFTTWRVIHIVIGLLGVATLVAHTGFRLGNNLNMWLTLTFLGLALAGTLAGAATALEHRISKSETTSAMTRSFSFWLHIILFWPFPLLLAAHILTVYFY